MKTAIVTGALGFLGRSVSSLFSKNGYRVYGVDVQPFGNDDSERFGIERYLPSSVTVESLRQLNCSPDVVVHCAGSGSVGFSLNNPFEDFTMTVDTTAATLEYLRTEAPSAKLVYPSSAAVYGSDYMGLISENSTLMPVSPYGVHKLIAERLCLSAEQNHGQSYAILRFFSLYGEGLRKQLLWDACRRLTSKQDETVEFFGTGGETRDWLHVEDAAALMLLAAESEEKTMIINSGSGLPMTVKDVLVMLSAALGTHKKIGFNNQVREGDPLHLQANVHKASSLGWQPSVKLEEGLRRYAEWYLQQIKC